MPILRHHEHGNSRDDILRTVYNNELATIVKNVPVAAVCRDEGHVVLDFELKTRRVNSKMTCVCLNNFVMNTPTSLYLQLTLIS